MTVNAKPYKTSEAAIRAAAKKSLFAYLNGSFSHFDAIEKDGLPFVVIAGEYPPRPFVILRQYVHGYSQ